MPVIPVDFSSVESFDNLPLGKYFGSVDKVELRPSTDPSKFDQLQVAYLVTDGEFLGRKQSEFLSLSPKAAFRVKRWFDAFGLADSLTELDIDDDTNLLMEPDLVGLNVIFEVYEDQKLYQGAKQIRTRLVSVEEDEPEPVPAPTPARRPAPTPAPVLEAVEDDGLEDEDPPEPVAAAPRRAAPAAVAEGPARRRTLR